MQTVFWISFAGLVYIYVGYPLCIRLLARMHPRPVRKGPSASLCSVVIVAHNEGGRIAGKLHSLLQCRDAHRIGEIIVASDGSTDHTIADVQAQRHEKIQLRVFAERRGKAAVLNEVIPSCRHELVVLTDARQELHPEAIGALLSNFEDPEVGVVSGELVFRDVGAGSMTASGMGGYWRYEKFIRRCEGMYASVPGATGALYAIRKNLFRPISPEALLDDVIIPMQAVVSGSRCVFESNAVVYDDPSLSARAESVRKRRTLAGNAQLIRLHPEWLFPRRNPIWFQYISHKMLRLTSPLLVGLLLVSNLFLHERSFYVVCLSGQGAFYVLAGLGWMADRMGKTIRILGLPYLFTALNATTMLALYDALRGRYAVKWEKSRGDL